jgi:PAS domain-containing protein
MVLPKSAKNLARTNDALLTEGSERERAVNQLRRSEAYLAVAQRLTKTGSWAFTPGREGWNYWSDELFRILEVDPRQGPLSRVQMYQRVHPEDRQQVSARYQKALKDKDDYLTEFRVLYPDGRLKYLHVIGHPVFNEAGEITEFVGTSIDVTEQKHREEALRRSETYLADAQKMTRTGSWAWAPGRDEWSYWSEEMFRVFEFDPRQGLPTVEMSRQRVHPEDRGQVSERARKTLQDKEEYVNDYRLQFPDGRLKYLHVIGHPVFNEAGEITEFVGTSVDVTEQKHIEEALRRSEAYLVEGQRLTHTGCWSLNIATRQILHSSAEHTRMFGFDPEKGTPRFEEFLQRIHPEDQEHVLETFQTLMRSGGDLDLRYRIATPDCPVRYMHAIGHPALKESSTPGEYVGITIDTTERRLWDQERERAENRLRRSEAYLAEAQRLSHTGSWAIDPEYLSRLNSLPHTIAVYASQWSSPSTTQHSLPGGCYALRGPDLHRLERASFLGALTAYLLQQIQLIAFGPERAAQLGEAINAKKAPPIRKTPHRMESEYRQVCDVHSSQLVLRRRKQSRQANRVVWLFNCSHCRRITDDIARAICSGR